MRAKAHRRWARRALRAQPLNLLSLQSPVHASAQNSGKDPTEGWWCRHRESDARTPALAAHHRDGCHRGCTVVPKIQRQKLIIVSKIMILSKNEVISSQQLLYCPKMKSDCPNNDNIVQTWSHIVPRMIVLYYVILYYIINLHVLALQITKSIVNISLFSLFSYPHCKKHSKYRLFRTF